MTKAHKQTIVLTGGSTGIGAAAALRLQTRGHYVTVLDIISPEGDTPFVHCDLADSRSIDSAIEQLPQPIDALVNVAGVSNAAALDTIMKVNFLGLRYLTEALVDQIVDAGSIVNVASTAGFDWRDRKDVITQVLDTDSFDHGLAWLSANKTQWTDNAYKFSKQCAAAYTYKAAGLAVTRGVRVNCVNPGSTGTQLTADFRQLVGEDRYDWGVQQIGREGTPDDIAEVIEFLAIGQCRWLNGVELTVDGGFIAGILGGWIDLDKAPQV